MATKTKGGKTAAETKPKPPNKTEKSAAYQSGRLAGTEEVSKLKNPHLGKSDVLRDEWNRGWTEEDDTINVAKEVAEAEQPKQMWVQSLL